MKAKQIDLWGQAVEVKRNRKPIDKDRQAWEREFQRWCDLQKADGNTPLGNCGYSNICDFCTDVKGDKPCVKALNRYLKSKRKTLDYKVAKFNEAWGIE